MSSETQQQQLKRKRVVSKGYSGLGCRTCRIRKLKCDEDRPICKQCLVAKRGCLYDVVQINFGEAANVQVVNKRGWLHADNASEVSSNERYSLTGQNQAAISDRSLASFDTYGQMQLQLRNMFIEDCRPNYNRTEGCFTSVLIVTDLSPRPLSYSANALALIHAASHQQSANDRLVYKAAELYGSALTYLRHALAVASPQKRKEQYSAYTVLLSMMLVAIYAEPQNIRPQGYKMENSWEQHLYAAARYIKAMGPTAFDLSSEIEGPAVHSAIYMSFKTSLCLRKSMLLEQDVHIFLTPGLAKALGIPVEMFQWHRPAFRLPGFLERTDSIMRVSGKTNDAVCDELVSSLIQTRQDLYLFSHTFLEPLTALTAPEDLDSTDPEHRFLLNTSLFRRQYQFPNLLICATCIITWLSCLLADCGALKLMHRRLESRNRSKDAASQLERSAFDFASQLCQTVYSLSRRENIIWAHTMSMVLKVAGAFFAELGACEEMNWCRACEAACRERFNRLEQTQRVTLCRVGSVTAALVGAVRYRRNGTLLTDDSIV